MSPFLSTSFIGMQSQQSRPHLRTSDASGTIPCPYVENAVIQLDFRPEGQPTSLKLDVRFVKVFKPFTMSEAAVVELVPGSRPVVEGFLPLQFVVKFFDARHMRNELPCMRDHARERADAPWTFGFRSFFLSMLRDFRCERWPNYWDVLGSRVFDDDGRRFYKEGDHLRRPIWAAEMDHWEEVVGWRSIPKFFGTATYVPPEDGMGDALLSTVPCFFMEYIEGASLDEFELVNGPGTDPSGALRLTEEDALRASHAIIEVARSVRNLGVSNNDIAAHNILLRSLDPLDPVMIDFGYAKTDGGARQDVCDVRGLLATLKWSLSSPYRARAETPNPLTGFAYENYLLGIAPRHREAFFDEIPEALRESTRITVDEHGREHTWQPARWKLKPNVLRTSDEDQEWGLDEKMVKLIRAVTEEY
ncbi:hypothetical protein GGX14DRAFT_670322 [Mycena pura]|uniref:Protein kinase domain-containing protein n=1 Tax=Mycena pura TaxID=153505 RepID=A0AAD6VSP8_9AGAR|nr:hypothetical protein GGX14DRAFT_670322 [Mycena pura]